MDSTLVTSMYLGKSTSRIETDVVCRQFTMRNLTFYKSATAIKQVRDTRRVTFKFATNDCYRSGIGVGPTRDSASTTAELVWT